MTQLRKFRDKTTSLIALLISTFIGFFSKPPPAAADEKPITVAQNQSGSVYNALRGGVYKTFDNSNLKEAPSVFNNSSLKEAPTFNNSSMKEAPAFINNSNLKEAPAFDNNLMKEAPAFNTFNNGSMKEAPAFNNSNLKEAPAFDNNLMKEAPSLNLTADVENSILTSVVDELEVKIRNNTGLTEADRAVLILIEQNRELSIENKLLKIQTNNGAPSQ